MIFADSNIWIFSNIQDYSEYPLAVRSLKKYEKEKIAINNIIFSEVSHKLSALLGKEESIKRTRKMIDSEFTVYVEIDRETAMKSLQHALSLRINDALIAQHAIDLKIPLLTDNLKDFKRIDNLNILPLR